MTNAITNAMRDAVNDPAIHNALHDAIHAFAAMDPTDAANDAVHLADLMVARLTPGGAAEYRLGKRAYSYAERLALDR